MKTCSIPDCGRPMDKRGMCSAHYRRDLKYGDPHGGRPTIRGAGLLFLETVAVPYQGDDCLIWPFARSDNGYGVTNYKGRLTYAHRVVCQLAHGEPPAAGMHAAHSCGKGHEGCVNPRHVRWATVRENQLDRHLHGTAITGEQSPASKLTEPQVLAIRASQEDKRVLAARYGVSPGHINRIRSGAAWAWLADEAAA